MSYVKAKAVSPQYRARVEKVNVIIHLGGATAQSFLLGSSNIACPGDIGEVGGACAPHLV